MTSTLPLEAGLLLAGRYRLDAPLATGGMAQVWRCHDTVLGRAVAAKVLHPHLAGDQAFLTRFRREAVAAARLSHRSIVAIYDTVADQGHQAIIMELIEGRTLRTVLDQVHILPTTDVIEIGIQVAEALGEAHRGGVVHRDIKPGNILLCPDRRVMVTDFGIAKAGEDTDLTVTGTLLGTAKYLSPEQVLGEEVDPRADLYSLGVVLFECLTGDPPFRAETDAATALARLHQDPPDLGQLRPELPTGLTELIHRLLARDPSQRPATALALRTALAALTRTLPGGRPPTADSTRVLEPGAHNAGPAPEADRTISLVEEDEEGEEADGFLRSERSWIVPALVVLGLAGALVVAGLLFSRAAGVDQDDGGGPVDSGAISLSPITELVEPIIADLRVLDRPELGGDGSENDHLLPLAHDGDTDTAWRSDTYHRARFGDLKPGLGLLIDLGGRARVNEVQLITDTDDWIVELFVGDDFTGHPDLWGAPLAGGDRQSGRETFDLAGAIGTHLLIWITDTGTSPATGANPGEDVHRFVLREIRVS